MSVQFLSEDYVAAMNDALAGHPGFTSAIAGVSLSRQFHVTDTPQGDDVAYYVDIADGGATAGLGELDNADVTVTNDYETAVGISSGELNTQMAFMTGKLKVAGDMPKLMLNISAVTELAQVMAGIDTAY